MASGSAGRVAARAMLKKNRSECDSLRPYGGTELLGRIVEQKDVEQKPVEATSSPRRKARNQARLRGDNKCLIGDKICLIGDKFRLRKRT